MKFQQTKKTVILSLTRYLQRLPFVNSGRMRARIKYGVTSLYYNGFTLIELLIVVLIIGILAAVALPQYQLVVAKAKVSSFLPLGKALASAQERYYLANGKYAADLRLLDVDIPSTCTINRRDGKYVGSGFLCGTDIFIDNAVAGADSKGSLSVLYCPGFNSSYNVCSSNRILTISFHFIYYSGGRTNTMRCNSYTELGKRMCAVLSIT